MKTVAVMLSLGAVLALGGCQTGAGPRPLDPVADIRGLTAAQAETLRSRVAATNSQNWAQWEALHTSDCVRTAPELDHPVVGSAPMRRDLERLVRSFPDYHVAVVRAVGHGDLAMVEFTAWGTYARGFRTALGFDLPATNKRFFQHWTAVVRFSGSQIVEFHEYWDQKDVSDQVMGLANPKPW